MSGFVARRWGLCRGHTLGGVRPRLASARPSSWRRLPRRSAALPDQPSRSRPALCAEEAWEALALSRRKLQVAVAEEDYRLAAELRDEIKDLTEALPSRKQVLLSMLDALGQEGAEGKAVALRVIGELGDTDALPRLSLCLDNPQLQAATEAAMWQIFLHHDSPRVQMLMKEGQTMMNRPGDWESCISLFSSVVEEAPSFAEGYNKRATVLFLLQRYRESVADCRVVLELNPYHFAAAAGMGTCLSRLGEYEAALQAYEQALAIHPGLPEVRTTIEWLKTMIKQQR